MSYSLRISSCVFFFFFQAEDGIRDYKVTGVQTCALPIFLPSMRERRTGCIVNVSALNAEVSPGMTHEAPAYFVAKTALAMMTKSMARLEGRHGIRVNAVSPGFIETDSYADWHPDEQARWRDQIPLGRFGRPDDVADAVEIGRAHV